MEKETNYRYHWTREARERERETGGDGGGDCSINSAVSFRFLPNVSDGRAARFASIV